MYRKLTMFLLLFTVTFFMVSCIQKTDKFSKKNKKEVVVDSIQMKIQALQDSVIIYQKQARVAVTRAEEVSVRCDSIANENQLLRAENQKFKAQLAQARDQVIPAMRQQYESLFEVQRCAIEEKDEKIQSLKNDLWIANDLKDKISNDRDAFQTELSNLKPWASKWQKDSKRSFIKVMFGAGKTPSPNVPTPQLE